MKLSYREKVGLLVVIVLLVIIVFVAWPIKTFRNRIKVHTEQKATVQKTYEETQTLINQIPTIEGNITKVYENSKGLSSQFAPHMENIDFAKYFETLLNKEPYKKGAKNELEIKGGLTITDATSDSIPFYYYTPDVITYPILVAADVNGDLVKKQDEVYYNKVQNALYLEEVEPQDVEVRVVSIPMKFTKEALLALEDEFKTKETGARITSVTINDYSFGKVAELPEDKGYSEGTVEFTFYTMQQIQEPVFN